MMITRIGTHNVFIDNSDVTAGRHRPCTGRARPGPSISPLIGDRLAANGFGTRFPCHMQAIKHAFPFPDNLRELRFPSWQAIIQVAPPIAPPILPIVALVKGDTLAEVLGLVPGVHNAWPQAGCYEEIQRGNELFVDHEPVRFGSVSVEYLPVKLLA